MDVNILSSLAIKKVYSVSNMYTEACKKAKRIDRPSWAIVLKHEGETIYTCKEKRYISNAENMIILPKGCNYEWQCTKAGRYYIIEFECDMTYDEIFSFPITNAEKFFQLFKDSEYKKTLKNPIYNLELLKNCYSILLLLLQSKPQKYQPSEKQQKIAAAVEYIAKNYTVHIKNEELAQQTGLSTVYFRKIFTETYGISPINYIHKLRIKKAIEMLQSDYDTLSDIAISLGYADIYDFSRTFKKHTGVSPSNYIKNHL